MKKFTLLVVMPLIIAMAADAQGVNRMFGLVGGYLQSNQQSNGFLFSTDNAGQNLQLQYDFPVTTFGANPANLEMIPYNGKLYGTTANGGLNNLGTIFEYDPVTNIYIKKFDFGPNVSATGSGPKGSLLLYNNKFYGLAEGGGTSSAGVIFEWDPATNIFTKKYDFTGAGGANPQNSLRLMNSKMYGTTVSGGSVNVGVAFEWDPATNVFTKLLDLNGSGAGTYGWTFYNSVTPYNNKIYCTTYRGGANDAGTLLMIDPLLPFGSNTSIIKNFDGASGTNAGNNEMIVYNNKLYGTLPGNGANVSGTIFELNPTGNVFTKLVDFNYTPTGRSPQGKLVANGTKFIGLCSEGGTNGKGTIFEWDPASPTTVVKKYDFLTNNFDNPINPGSTFSLFNSKFYAVTYNGGFANQGVLFEYDYAANTLTKKKTFNAAENGRIPYGRPTLLNGKIYGTCYQGPQEVFGTPYGCMWEFDPSTSIYSRKFLFTYDMSLVNGRVPLSSPIAYNNKLYGTTNNGGTSDVGVLYEYDPVTDAYAKKDMQAIAGSFPIGEPTLYNNKLYGMTNANGIGNNGIIYSFDPATSTLAKLYDVQNAGSNTPSGGFTVYNNKLYGATSGGASNNAGGIIIYDPANNTASTVASFSGSLGVTIQNAPTLYNNKFYMNASSGGANGRGAILMFDPATNALTNIYSYSTLSGLQGFDPAGEFTVNGGFLYCITHYYGDDYVIRLDPTTNLVTVQSTYTPSNTSNIPVAHNGLTVVPAFIANGLPNNCETYPTVVINGANNNQWVPILNNTGDVVAEIKANGNNLGNVDASVYINTGTVREDGTHQLYMDRNISIAVQNTPSSNVDIRLYVKSNEFTTLKNAINSLSQPSGINNINDVSIFKSEQSCASGVIQNSIKITTTTENYEYGYVLSASVGSFSTFFFAKNTFSVLPLKLISFNAVKDANNVKVLWSTENEINLLQYEVEKSNDGVSFTKFATTAAKAEAANSYKVIDDKPVNGNNYYRLKQLEKDGKFAYSNVIKINFSNKPFIRLSPNPASDIILIDNINAGSSIQLIDPSGRTAIKMQAMHTQQKINITHLPAGVYFIKVVNAQDVQTIQFVKD